MTDEVMTGNPRAATLHLLWVLSPTKPSEVPTACSPTRRRAFACSASSPGRETVRSSLDTLGLPEMATDALEAIRTRSANDL
jgi:hypothetical protein